MSVTSRASPLATLLEHEQRERDVALAAMHEARAHAQHAQAQADELHRYRHDYMQRWSQRFRQTQQGAVEIVQCYHSFLARLDQAVGQQAAVASRCEQRLAAQRDELREHEQRVAAVQKLIERQQEASRRLEQRAEQRQADDIAQRSHARFASTARAFGGAHAVVSSSGNDTEGS